MVISLESALQSTSESNHIEFKSEFDCADKFGWCEIVKDIVAIANTGGGVLIFGLDDNGIPTRNSPVLNGVLDPADITNKLKKYTNHQFNNFEIIHTTKGGHELVALIIGQALPPLIFSIDSLQKHDRIFAFRKGVLYFRHGAKSEPGDRDDLLMVFAKHESQLRAQWLDKIVQVSSAPLDSKLVLVGKDSQIEVRMTTDPNALPLRPPEEFSTKEVIEKFFEITGESVNPYDILCVTTLYGIRHNTTYCRLDSHYSAPLYFNTFIDFLIKEYSHDANFFRKARSQYSDYRKSKILPPKLPSINN